MRMELNRPLQCRSFRGKSNNAHPFHPCHSCQVDLGGLDDQDDQGDQVCQGAQEDQEDQAISRSEGAILGACAGWWVVGGWLASLKGGMKRLCSIPRTSISAPRGPRVSRRDCGVASSGMGRPGEGVWARTTPWSNFFGCIVCRLTPVWERRFRRACWRGAGPRRSGRREGWMLRPP